MKIFKNVAGKCRIGVTGFLCLLLSSCLKKDDTPPVAPQTALLSFVQASPNQPPMDFYLSTRVNLSPIYFGDNVDYVSAAAGQRTAYFNAAGTMNGICSGNITLNPNMAYTLFLTNTVANPQLLLLTDTLTKPAATDAAVRFVALSPDAPAVDFAIQGGDVLAANKSFKSYSSFINVPGKSSYTFEIRKAGTNVVLATLPNIPMVTGYLYTIWFGGLVNNTSNADALTARVVVNAFYQ